jgi:predicted anti-sigma-YlaC factor YlaD
MKRKMCQEFEMWLERLPRQELSPAFRRHLGTCERCRLMYKQLSSVAEALTAVQDPDELDRKKLENLTDMVQKISSQHKKHLLALKLCFLSFLSFPFVVLGGWLIASLSYDFIATNISLSFARTFLILFIVTAVLFSGIMYSSIHLIAGWIWTQKYKEREA